MPLYFSAQRTAFYDSAIHRELPADAVEISKDQHAAILAGLAEGKRIGADRRGHPCLLKPEAVPLADRRAQALRRARAEARRRILAVASLEQQSNDNADLAIMAFQAAAGEIRIDAGDALARRGEIDAIRAAGDTLKQHIAGLSAQALATFDVTSDHHWTN